MIENYRQDIWLHLGHTISSSVSVVQYDTARELHFFIDDYMVPDEAEIRIYIKKPSGKEIYNHCLLTDNEIILYPTTQMFAECGLNFAQIQIVKNNKTLTSFRFDIEVSESYAENAIPSTNEFTILDALIIEAREIIKAEAARVEAENTRNENEQVRISNENTRILNENNRTEAENERVEAENSRVLAETNRVNAENAREVAELKRQEDTSNAIDNCNTATMNANNAAENANSVSEEIEQKALNGDFSATISHVEAISGEPDTEASVENTGTAKDARLLFTIPKGTPAGFGTVSATVEETGEDEPEVTIEADGSNEQKNFNFTFKNIKGKQGEKGDPGENADLSTDTVEFTETDTRVNITSGETLPKILGKIKKFFTDLKEVAFSGSYSDLLDKPTIGNGKVIIKQANTQKGSFTLNQTGDTTIELTDNNTTYSNMTAATASAAGKAGLAPAPAAGSQVKYLRGDGTWQALINSLTATAAGFALDARQGKALNDKITTLNSKLMGSGAAARVINNPWGNELIIPLDRGIHGFLLIDQGSVQFIWVAGNLGSMNFNRKLVYGSEPDFVYSVNKDTGQFRAAAMSGSHGITYIGV